MSKATFLKDLNASVKRGISAVQLAAMLGTTYKTAWSMLRRIRAATGQRNELRQLSGVIEFDDAYFGGPTAGKKNLQAYLDEYSFRFSRRYFGGALLDRLALAVALSRSADQKG